MNWQNIALIARKDIDSVGGLSDDQMERLYRLCIPEQYQMKVEELEIRIAELIKERDKYDARRREAMEKVEEWRTKCWKLEKKLKDAEPILVLDALRRGDFEYVESD